MITVEHLTKYYGDFLAVDDLSFEIEDGHVYGFLGPNGAGKSTTMNIMTGCLSASDGHVKINGYDILEEPEQAKRTIGYLPELPPLYTNETPLEYLVFVAEAKGLKGKELERQVTEVIRMTGIDHVKNRLISNLSKGYRQRVGIAQALLGNPDTIILDEPTVGLDPIQIIEIRDLIRELGKEHTVILSSHILSEVQAICEKVLIISNGKLVAYDEPENLEKLMHTSTELNLVVEAEEQEVPDILSTIPAISSWTVGNQNDGTLHITIQAEGDIDRSICRDIFFAFAGEKHAILEMSSRKANLEDVFIELTENDQTEAPAVDGAEEETGEPDAESLPEDIEENKPEPQREEEEA